MFTGPMLAITNRVEEMAHPVRHFLHLVGQKEIRSGSRRRRAVRIR